nr:DUF3265 domain-containing protein [Vibrio sp. 03_296]
MTKRLRGIWHAWHFRFALGSVIKSLCGSFVVRACTLNAALCLIT